MTTSDQTWAEVVAAKPKSFTQKPSPSTPNPLPQEESPLLKLPASIQLKIFGFLYGNYNITAKVDRTVYGPHIPSTVDCGDERNQWHTRRLHFSGLPDEEVDGILLTCRVVNLIASKARVNAFTGVFRFWSAEPATDVLKFCKKYLHRPKYSLLLSRVRHIEFGQCTGFDSASRIVIEAFPKVKSIRVMVRGTEPHDHKCTLWKCPQATPVYTTNFGRFIDYYKNGLYDGTTSRLFSAKTEELKACTQKIATEVRKKVKIKIRCLSVVQICDGLRRDRYLLATLYGIVDGEIAVVRRSVKLVHSK